LLGNFGNRGVDIKVSSADDLATSHGGTRYDAVTSLQCVGERGF
jgi:hypothetical protein